MRAELNNWHKVTENNITTGTEENGPRDHASSKTQVSFRDFNF
jgi:hypothetical protein